MASVLWSSQVVRRLKKEEMINITFSFTVFLLASALTACGDGAGASGKDQSSGTLSQPGSSTPPTVASTSTPAGNASSLEGVDSAGRGYRDDVQQLIHDSFSSDPKVQAAVIQDAKDYQLSIEPASLQQTDTSSMILLEAQNTGCFTRGMTIDQLDATLEATNAVYARTFNTDARMAARQTFVSLGAKAVDITPDLTKCQ